MHRSIVGSCVVYQKQTNSPIILNTPFNLNLMQKNKIGIILLSKYKIIGSFNILYLKVLPKTICQLHQRFYAPPRGIMVYSLCARPSAPPKIQLKWMWEWGIRVLSCSIRFIHINHIKQERVYSTRQQYLTP